MNKRKPILMSLLLILFLVSLPLSAQSTTGRRSSTTTHLLTITSNVAGATVDINNGAIRGTTTYRGNVAAGSFIVIVSAPGYNSVRKRINLDSAQTHDFQLQPVTARLNVTSNVNGATIMVTGASNAQGNAPWRADLPLGNYNVTVSATGYNSMTKSVNLQKHENLHFNLQPAMATVQVIIPPESLNMKDVNARSMIQIYDNGVLMNGSVLTLNPGQHTIQIVSGGLMTQTTIVAEAGRTYTIKPILSLLIE